MCVLRVSVCVDGGLCVGCVGVCMLTCVGSMLGCMVMGVRVSGVQWCVRCVVCCVCVLHSVCGVLFWCCEMCVQ